MILSSISISVKKMVSHDHDMIPYFYKITKLSLVSIIGRVDLWYQTYQNTCVIRSPMVIGCQIFWFIRPTNPISNREGKIRGRRGGGGEGVV